MVAAQYAVSQLAGEQDASAKESIEKLRKAAVELLQEQKQDLPDAERVDQRAQAVWKAIGGAEILPTDALVQEGADLQRGNVMSIYGCWNSIQQAHMTH